MGFPQAAQTDWRTLDVLSSEIVRAVLATNVKPETVRAALAVSRNIRPSPEARRRILDAVNGLKCTPIVDKLIWFGFGVRHIVRILAATDQGLACLCLCSCLMEAFNANESAVILHELAVLSIPVEMRPSLAQWLELLTSCSGAIGSTDFGVTAEGFMSLNKDKNVLSSDKFGGRFGHDGDRTTGNTKDVAKAFYEMCGLLSGSSGSVTIVGGSICGWIAAVGYWLLGLTVEIARHDGEGLIFASHPSQHSGHLYVKYIAPENYAGVAVGDRVYVIGDPKGNMIYGIPRCTEPPISRVRWTETMRGAFAAEGEGLSKHQDLGRLIGSIARILDAFAWQDPAVIQAHGDDAFEMLQRWVGYRKESYGEGYIDFAIRKFPELKGLQSTMKECLCDPYLVAVQKNTDAITGLAASCTCTLCSNRGQSKSEDLQSYCLAMLAEAIAMLIWALSLTEFETDMDPNRAGLQSFYNKHIELVGHPLAGRTPTTQNSPLHVAPVYRILTYLDIAQLFDTTSILFTVGLHTGPRGSGPNRIATARGCVCFYLDVLTNPLHRSRENPLLRVLLGGIQYTSDENSGQLCKYIEDDPSSDRDLVWNSNGGLDPNAGISKDVTWFVKETKDGISIKMDFKMADRRYVVGPRHLTDSILRARGTGHYPTLPSANIPGETISKLRTKILVARISRWWVRRARERLEESEKRDDYQALKDRPRPIRFSGSGRVDELTPGKLVASPGFLDGRDDYKSLKDRPRAIRLNDNGRMVKLTPGKLVPSPGFLDGIKELVEKCVQQPINWWPLDPKKARCAEGQTRISWECACGTELHVDLPTEAAKEYAKQCASVASASSSTGEAILPMYSSEPDHSNQVPNKPLGSPGPSRRQNCKPLAKRLQQPLPPPRTLHIHWCVDGAIRDTHLVHVPVVSLDDVGVIHQLKISYSAIRGFRHWLSITTCCGVKFVSFERAHNTEELVACGAEDLPSPGTNSKYEYSYTDPQKQFIKTLEASLMHHFHNPRGCGAEDIQDVLRRIPKFRGRLERVYGAPGYGMHAVPGWALWKLLVAIAVSQIGPLAFAIRWLCGHPGDLQNAFTLSMYLVGVLNLFVIVPDSWYIRG